MGPQRPDRVIQSITKKGVSVSAHSLSFSDLACTRSESRISHEVHTSQFLIQRERPRVIRERVSFVRDRDDVEVSYFSFERVVTERIRECDDRLSSCSVGQRHTSSTDTVTERVNRASADLSIGRGRLELRVVKGTGNLLGFFRKYLDASRLQIVAVGDGAKVADSRKAFGTLETYDTEGRKVGD